MTMGYGYGPGWGMMGGWGGYGGYGYGSFHMIIWIVILIAIVALVVWLVRSLAGGGMHGMHNMPPRRSSGLDVLEERYARGEINRDEYLQKKKDIGG
jgi:putative membrane protein